MAAPNLKSHLEFGDLSKTAFPIATAVALNSKSIREDVMEGGDRGGSCRCILPTGNQRGGFLQSQTQISLAESLGIQARLGFVALQWGSPWHLELI